MAAKRTKTSARLPRDQRGGVDLAALDAVLDLLGAGAPSRRRRRSSVAPPPPRSSPPPGLAEPGPVIVTAVGALLSLPPPPSSLPPLSLTHPPMVSAIPRDDLREPSLPPPSGEVVDPLTTLYPPRLSLAPLPVDATPAPTPLPAPSAPQLSLAPEALELDLSVLGPSELPAESSLSGDSVPVVELDVVELDEVRLSGEPQAPRRVAPPLPPPVLRRAR